MTVVLSIIGLLFLTCLFLFLWMRWRMSASKGRFAIVTISSLVSCLSLGLSAASLGLPGVVLSKISIKLGYGPIASGAPNIVVIFLTIVAMILIYEFGKKAIQSWEGSPRISDTNLAQKNLENNLMYLAIEHAKLTLNGQSDSIANDVTANWKEKLAQPPKPIEAKDLLRELLVASCREVQIHDDGWRDDGELWLGEISGMASNSYLTILAVVFKKPPNKEDIETRLDSLRTKVSDFKKVKIFAIYLSDGYKEKLDRKTIIDGKMVEVLSSRRMILMGLDLHSYARQLLQYFNSTKVGGTKATLRTSYVDLIVRKSGAPDTALDCTLSDLISNWLQSDNNAHIAITGEYGQGKSTALLKYCCDWAERFLHSGSLDERVPLLIELRGKNPSESDPLSFLSTWCSRYGLLPQSVLNLIKMGDAVVIFEGFDELLNVGTAFYRHQQFNALWRFAYPGTKLVFTGRPNFFFDEGEANRTLRNDIVRVVGGDAHTEVWRILKLDERQIALACRSYDENVKNGIIKSIASNKDFLEIVSRPSMLPVVATIWNEIADKEASGMELTGAVLIEMYTQAIFARKEAELERDRVVFDAQPGSRYLLLPKQVRELLTLCVAWRMSGLELKNTISRAEITDMVREIYDTLFTIAKSEGIAPTISEGMIDFEKRHEEKSLTDRVESITTEICSAGLMIPDPTGGASNLQYPHKQFYEFMIAKSAFICRCPKTNNGSKIISTSSNEKQIFKRLLSEPNSIQYLAEFSGEELSNMYYGLDLNTSAVFLKFLNLLPKTMFSLNLAKEPESPSPYFPDNVGDNYSEANNEGNNYFGTSSKILGPTYNHNLSRRTNAFFLCIAFILLLIFVSLAGILGLFTTMSTILKMSTFLGLTLLVFSLSNIFVYHVLSPSQILVLEKHVYIKLKKAGQEPENYVQGLDLLIQAILKGEVIYPEEKVVTNINYTEFLYPANYFNDA